jgi:hypothetical protein
MAELQLERTPGERRVYALEGLGTLRLTGLTSRTGVAEAGGRRWELGRRGFWRRGVQATDEAGAVVGEFEPRGLRRGGTVRWGSGELTLRPASRWRERYALAAGDRELAVLDGKGKGWGRRPVSVTVDDGEALDPGLLLFAAFVVRRLAEDAGGAAAGVGAPSTGA